MKNRTDFSRRCDCNLKHSAFDTAAYYLGFRDRSSCELKKKLAEKGYSEIEIVEAINKLTDYGYIDDNRYARAYIRQQCKRKGGRLIVNELRQKGIDKEVSLEELCELKIDEDSVIDDLFVRHFSELDLSEDKQYRRVYSYFVRRGFDYDKVLKIIAKHRKNN